MSQCLISSVPALSFIMIINLMQFMTLISCSHIWSTRSREF